MNENRHRRMGVNNMRFITLIALMFLTACNATTKLSGYVDPAYRNNFQAKKIVVTSVGIPLDERKGVEDTFIESLEGYEVEVIRGLDIYPPTRDIPTEQLLPIAKKNGADSLLLFFAGARDVQESYVPPTFHPGSSTSYISGYGNYATVNTYTTPGYTTGGYNISRPSMAVFVTLFDAKNRKTIWEAEGTSGGNAFSEFKDLSISTARTSVTELSNAGLLAKREGEPEKKDENKRD